jgi:hypothetical protein
MKCVLPLGLVLLFFNLSIEAQNFTTTNAQKLIQSGEDSQHIESDNILCPDTGHTDWKKCK